MSCVFNSARSRIWLIWTAVALAADSPIFMSHTRQQTHKPGRQTRQGYTVVTSENR